MARTHLWPNGSRTKPHQTSPYGMRWNPVTGAYTLHAGVDLTGFYYNRSSDDGVVTFARYNGGAGNEVRVRHKDGTETRYKHNARFLVREGQRVARAAAVGVMGTTGSSTGIHCHFETRIGPLAAPINPDEFMATRLLPATTTAGGTTSPLPPEQNGDVEMRLIYNVDNSNEDTRRAIIGELSFQVITSAESQRERTFWGDPENVTQGEWAAAQILVQKRRAAVGLPPAAQAPLDIDEAALAAALAPLLGTGVSDAELAAAVASIKAAIPTTFTAA